MSKISNIKIDQNTYDIRATAIPYGVVDDTSTSTVYTVTVPGITELTDGVCCLIKNGKVTSESGFTLNVNGLGAKPSYSNMATGNPVTPTNPTRDTTIFNINYTMLFIYSSTLVDGGAWICYRGYDANTNTIGYQVRSNSHSLPASQKFYRYRLLFTSADGTHYVPANTSSSTNATASRTVNQTPIDPFGHIVYYGTTAAVEANARPAASSLWVIYTLSLGYSFNRTGAALNLTSWKPVYIKCAPQSNGSAIIDADTPYVQALPTTNDGKIYIFLGVAYNATSIELLNSHPVYYHDGTGIRVWTGKKIATKVSELTNDSGFITSSSLNGYATESYVDNKVPFIANVTISTNPSTGTVTASSITTHAQIKEAVAAGRSVYVKTSIGTVLHLIYINNDEAHFSIVGESPGWMMQQISCTSSNVWSVVNSGLAAVATSGSYNDLTDQPNIPSIAGLATETYVNTAVSNLVDSAPQTLDTLNELAAALGDDPNFATTVATQIGNKQDKPMDFILWSGDNFNDFRDFPSTEETARELTSDEQAALTAIVSKSNWVLSEQFAPVPLVHSTPNTGEHLWAGVASNGTNVQSLSMYLHKTNDNKYWYTNTLSSAVNSDSLATVATSGSYNDLTNKPKIPTLPDNIVINQDPDEDYTGLNIPILLGKPLIYCEVRGTSKSAPKNVLVIKGALQFLTSEYTPILMRKSTKSSGRGWHYCGRIGTKFELNDIAIEDVRVVGNNFRLTGIEKCLTIDGEYDILPYLSSVKGALASQGYINDDYYHPNSQPRRLMYVPHGKRQITLLRANNDNSIFKTNFKARWGISFIKSSEVNTLNLNTRLDVSKLVTSIAEFKIFYRWNKPLGSSNTFLLKTLIV